MAYWSHKKRFLYCWIRYKILNHKISISFWRTETGCIAIQLTVFYMIWLFTERYFRTDYNCLSYIKILETKPAFINASLSSNVLIDTVFILLCNFLVLWSFPAFICFSILLLGWICLSVELLIDWCCNTASFVNFDIASLCVIKSVFLNPSRKLFLTETSIRAVNLEMFSVYLTVSELTGLSIYSIFFFCWSIWFVSNRWYSSPWTGPFARNVSLVSTIIPLLRRECTLWTCLHILLWSRKFHWYKCPHRL